MHFCVEVNFCTRRMMTFRGSLCTFVISGNVQGKKKNVLTSKSIFVSTRMQPGVTVLTVKIFSVHKLK